MKQKQKNYIIIGVFALVAIFIVMNNLPAINVNVPTGENGDTIIQLPDTSGGTVYVPPEPSSSAIEPTSLMLSFYDTSIKMGETLSGTVVSDGKDYPITVHAYYIGTATEQTYGGLIGDSGKFYDSNVMNVPGYWDFWVTTDTVTSNKPRVTVEGVLVTSSHSHYSHTFDTPIVLKLYSHTSGNAQIIAVDPVHFTMTPLGNTVINTNGYGEIAPDFGVLPNGTYEITCLINGLDSADYGPNPIVEVGR